MHDFQRDFILNHSFVQHMCNMFVLYYDNRWHCINTELQYCNNNVQLSKEKLSCTNSALHCYNNRFAILEF